MKTKLNILEYVTYIDHNSLSIGLDINLKDIWIGIFWDDNSSDIQQNGGVGFDLYICLVPCLPFYVKWRQYFW